MTTDIYIYIYIYVHNVAYISKHVLQWIGYMCCDTRITRICIIWRLFNKLFINKAQWWSYFSDWRVFGVSTQCRLSR